MKLTTNSKEVAKELERSGVLTERHVKKAVARTAKDLQARIMKNASTGYHRRRKKMMRGHIPGTGPGPNVATGNYRRSIQVTHDTTNAGPRSIVHTNAPQARRLEYGFRGTDSRGRTYNQPPYPHWQHAMSIVKPSFQREIEKAIREALGNAQK